MPDTLYKDFGKAAQNPAFRLGYEHPELLDALAKFGPSLSERRPYADRAARYAAVAFAENQSVNSEQGALRVFSIGKKEELIHAVLLVAHELAANVSLMGTDQQGVTCIYWTSLTYSEQDHKDFSHAFYGLLDRGAKPFLDIIPWRRRPNPGLRVMLD